MRTMILSLVALATAPALPAQTPAPPANASIFDKAVNQPGIGWTVYGPDQKTKQIAAAEVPGGNAVHVQVMRVAPHPWDVGAQYPTVKPVAAGDTLLVMVYLRAPDAKEGATLPIPIGASEADAPYTPIADETVQVGPSWKRYFASGVTQKAFAPGKARIALQLGGAKQAIDVGPAFLLDLGRNVDRAKLPHN